MRTGALAAAPHDPRPGGLGDLGDAGDVTVAGSPADAGGPARVPAEAPPASRRLRNLLAHLAVLGGFTLLAALMWWRVWIVGHPTTTITCQCGDSSQELWFLAWTPWALLHGHSPLWSNAIFAGQGGANMVANTSWIAPSVALAPVTLAFGPIAAFNVGAVLGPAVSGWSCFFAARRLTAFVPGQIGAGLVYGFSPFVIWNDPIGHLDFTLLFFAPLAFVLLHGLVVDRARSPVRTGLSLGVLVVVQFFTSTEFLAMCTLCAGVAGVVAVVLAPRAARLVAGRLAVALGVAAALSSVVLGYPLAVLLTGPAHVVGAPWPNSPSLGASPAAIVNAGVAVHSPAWFEEIGGYFGGAGPNFGASHFPSLLFLGIPLIALLAASAATWYRSRVAWVLVAIGLFAWTASFGTMLGSEFDPRRRAGPSWLPWNLLSHVPLVSQIEPIRFGALVTFAAALLLAISLDRWRVLTASVLGRVTRGVAPRLGGRATARNLASLGVSLVGAAVLVPIAATNTLPFVVRPSAVPPWFATAARHLPGGTVVLVMPFGDQRAMGWQAQTGFSFRLAGGFAVVPAPDGRSAFVSEPAPAVQILDRLSPAPGAITSSQVPSTAPEVAVVRAALETWGVDDVVVTEESAVPVYVAAFMTAVMGRLPTVSHDAWVWQGSGVSPPVAVGPGLLARCSTPAPGHVADGIVSLAAPRCVLASAQRRPSEGT